MSAPIGVEYPAGSYALLTKREYFAELAMQGILANPESVRLSISGAASLAVAAADALLAELAK